MSEAAGKPSEILRAHSDVARDPRKRPTLGDRFINEFGYVIEVVAMGTRDFRPYFQLRQSPGAKLYRSPVAASWAGNPALEAQHTTTVTGWWQCPNGSGRDVQHLLGNLRVLEPFDQG